MQKPSIPKGTRDFGPAEVHKRKYILSIIEGVFKKYGFMPIETPTMENLSTLEGKYGEEGDKLLFRILNSGDAFKSLKDKSGDQQIGSFEFKPSEVAEKGLRYDLTVPFARYVVMNRNQITFPFKRYQMQPVWRADRPQKGRYREFWQCDADVVGSDSLVNELDLIQIYHESFTTLGITDYEIRINNRKILAGIAQIVKSSDHMQTIAVAIDKLDKIGETGVRDELREKEFSEEEIQTLFQLISTQGENLIAQLKAGISKSEEGIKGADELAFIIDHVKVLQPNIRLKVDFSLARGLSYYTGSIFEVVSKKGTLTSSIGGGGRYDNLTGIFGLPGVSGVGISFGLDRIYDVMEELNLFPLGLNNSPTQVLVFGFNKEQQQAGLDWVKRFRNSSIAAECYPDLPASRKEMEKPMVKPMQYADALKIPFTVFPREDQWIMKDMINKSERVVTYADALNILKS